MEGASPAVFCCSPLKCWINKLQVTDAIHFWWAPKDDRRLVGNVIAPLMAITYCFPTGLHLFSFLICRPPSPRKYRSSAHRRRLSNSDGTSARAIVGCKRLRDPRQATRRALKQVSLPHWHRRSGWCVFSCEMRLSELQTENGLVERAQGPPDYLKNWSRASRHESTDRTFCQIIASLARWQGPFRYHAWDQKRIQS